MSWYVHCANCGKEVLIDGPEDKCYLCGKNASKKEVIMQKTKAVAAVEAIAGGRAVPLKPKNRMEIWGYYEQNKEAILADYHSLKLITLFAKWSISSQTWHKLKKLWELSNKRRHPKNVKREATSSNNGIVKLTEHEQYLMLLGYQQAVREFLKYT